MLYHAGVPGLGGGFTGVDVFFVLSGFLITGLLVRELRTTGRVLLPAFYARRARRLLPAAAVVVAATLAGSALLLPPLRLPDVAGDAAAAAVYAANLRFAVQATDYLGSELAPSPLLHTWSLGVEEQFYLLWPAFLLVLAGGAFARGDDERGLRRLTLGIGAVLAGSFTLSLALTAAAQPWAFFSLPARAWELALGGLLALPAAARALPGRLAPAAGWAGLALVVGAGVALGGDTAFPGWAALVPTAGAALVIAAGTAARLPGEPPPAGHPARLLGLAPLRVLGRISYSLYLWHWPVLVLPAAALGPLPGPVRLALAGLAVLCAAASWRWVEEPIRHGRLVGAVPRRNLALAGALTVALATASLGVAGAAGSALAAAGPAAGGSLDEVPGLGAPSAAPEDSAAPGSPGSGPVAPTPSPDPTPRPAPAGGPVPADLAPSLARARADLPATYGDGCHLDLATVAPGPCAYGEPASATTVVLFGDSHAAQWFPALERLATERAWRLVSLTKSGCPSADVAVWSGIVRRAYTECDAWRTAALARIADERPALVVVANSRRAQLLVDGVPVPTVRALDAWRAGLARTLASVARAADAVVVLGDTPRSGDDPPACLSAHLADALACAIPWAEAVDTAHLDAERTVAAAAGIPFVDTTPWVCATDPCPVVRGRFLVYRDEHHLSATYARALAAVLGAALPGPAG